MYSYLKYIVALLVQNMFLVLWFTSDSIFASSSCEALQTSLLLSKDYGLLSFLRKSLASEEVHLNEHPANSNIVNLKFSWWQKRFFLSFSAPGHPSWGLIFFGEVLGQGLAKSQRVGEDLRHWHKSKSTFRTRLNVFRHMKIINDPFCKLCSVNVRGTFLRMFWDCHSCQIILEQCCIQIVHFDRWNGARNYTCLDSEWAIKS